MFNKTRVRLALLILGILLVGGILIVLNRPTTAVANMGPTITPLIISQAQASTTPSPTVIPTAAASPISNALKATGTLQSASQASLAFQVAGRIKDLKIKEGDGVKAGTVLAALDTSVLEFQIAQAQAGLDLAKANYDRIKAGPTTDDIALAKSNVDRAKSALDQAQAAFDRAGGDSNPLMAMLPQSVALQQAYAGYQAAVAQYNLAVKRPTDADMKTAQAQLAQAQATYDLTKQNMINSIITAPFDGTVLAVNPKVGESVSVGAIAIVLADLTHMQALVNVDENTLATLRVGQKVKLTLDALGGKTLTGSIRKIGLLGSAATGIVSVPVTIDIDATNAVIYPGLSTTIEFQTTP